MAAVREMEDGEVIGELTPEQVLVPRLRWPARASRDMAMARSSIGPIGASACTARGTGVAALEGLSDNNVNKQAESS